MDVAFEELDRKWQGIKGSVPEDLALRIHRALSWLERAEIEPGNDPDSSFVFHWIAFNAMYAQGLEPTPAGARQSAPVRSERTLFSEYFERLLPLDASKVIDRAIWPDFLGLIRDLLENPYVYQPFWNHHMGRGSHNWKQWFGRENKQAMESLANQHTHGVLTTVFDRLYTLRIQLMHGGATWQSNVNRKQVQDGKKILAFLVPLFMGLMMDNPDVDWGTPEYPVVPST